MINKFLDDYEQIILICANKNYSKEQTEEVLSALELYQCKKYKQAPRTKELNLVINAVFKTKFNENHDPQNGQFTGGSGGGGNSNEKSPNDNKAPSSSPAINPKNGLPFDGNKALKNLNNNLQSQPGSKCAKNVGDAIRAGNVPLEKPTSAQAKDYGKPLEDAGFKKVSENAPPIGGYKPKDVAVVQPYPGGHPARSMAMHDGNRWKSDFAQNHAKPYGGQGAMNAKPDYAIYRHPNW